MATCFNTKKSDNTQESITRLDKVVDNWFNNPVIDAMTSGNEGSFQRFYENVLNLDYDYGRMPTPKEITKLENETNRYLKNLTSVPTKPAQWFLLPENILKKNPITKKYFDGLVRASNYYRGNQQELKGDLASMVKLLNKASGESNLLSKFGYGKNKAQRELAALKQKYDELKTSGNKVAAEAFYQKNLKDISENNPNYEVNKRFFELITNPSLVNKQNLNKSKLKYGGELIQAANLWHNGYKDVRNQVNVKPLKERLWKVLGDGLKKNINIIKKYRTDFNNMKGKIDELETLYNDYFAKDAPKRIKDYFPTQVLDIAPTLSKFNQDINKGFLDSSEGQKSVQTYISRMVEDVTKALKTPGNIYEQNVNRPKRIDQDVVGILDNYVNSTIRFNYNAAVTEQLVDALQSLNRISNKTDYDTTVRFLSDYIYDMHQHATGNAQTNSKLANMARTITSYQFLSKLGLNIRTVARNATQSLQNWVYFGTKGIYTAMGDYKDPTRKKITDRELARHGFEFVNIQEIAFPKDLLNNVTIDESGKVIQNISTMGRKFNDYLEEAARITGKPMQWVENHVNRGMTFKIAFNNRYNALIQNDTYIKDLLKKQKKGQDTKSIEEAAIRKASNYAADMVKELHYQYDPWAKIKATRSPVGAVLGQFSTYAINFFEYQRKIATKGTNAILAREWNNPEIYRMLRLGMLYTAVTGISAVTNTNFGTLVQNDTAERLSRLNQYLGGDKEDKEKAFFGLDPITSTFGGPFVSDIMKLGSILNYNNLSEDDMAVFSSAHREFHEAVNSSKTEELVRFFNGQAARTLYTTFPRMINGTNMGTLFFQELGLYSTPELKGLKGKILKPFQQLPGDVGKAFKPKSKKKKESFANTKFSEEEITSILSAFE